MVNDIFINDQSIDILNLDGISVWHRMNMEFIFPVELNLF
jgi:hypothetical protein